MKPEGILRLIAAALLGALLQFFASGAQAQSCTPKSGATRIITINGVANPNIGDADANAGALQSALNYENPASSFKVESFWSPGYGEGLSGTLFDVLAAAELTNRGRSSLDFLAAIFAARNPADIQAIIALRSTLLESQRPVINNLKNLIRTGVQNGQKFVLVPHSRGNLIVSATLDELRQENSGLLSSIGVVGIASPDIQRAGDNYLYISRSDDGVARLSSMPPNFTPVNSADIVSAHPFITAYLDPRIVDAADTSVMKRVVSAIGDMKASVENCGVEFVISPPSATVSVGSDFTFTVTATNVPESSLSLLSRLQWRSARTDIASISGTGSAGQAVTGTVHGESVADTTISVTDEITGRVQRATVTVAPAPVTCNASTWSAIATLHPIMNSKGGLGQFTVDKCTGTVAAGAPIALSSVYRLIQGVPVPAFLMGCFVPSSDVTVGGVPVKDSPDLAGAYCFDGWGSPPKPVCGDPGITTQPIASITIQFKPGSARREVPGYFVFLSLTTFFDDISQSERCYQTGIFDLTTKGADNSLDVR